MEQTLINLIAGALGGVGAGKASQTFDLGTAGNVVSSLVGGGVYGEDGYVSSASGRGRSAIGQSEYQRHCLTGDRRRRWRGHTHGGNQRNQEQSNGLTIERR